MFGDVKRLGNKKKGALFFKGKRGGKNILDFEREKFYLGGKKGGLFYTPGKEGGGKSSLTAGRGKQKRRETHSEGKRKGEKVTSLSRKGKGAKSERHGRKRNPS